jgi:N-hydroxyarylamine O-acetyltransferase
MAIKPLSSTAVDQVVERLGFAERPSADLAGLHAVYSAWCRRVPFDNLRKLVGLHFAMPELPGIHPDDFFAAWQLTGAGGTCWGSNNAIHALLDGLGFDARRFAASMFDGDINHGTTIVTIDGDSWLVDTAVHGDVPVPLRSDPTSVEHEGYVTTARRDGGGWVFECPTPDPEVRIPCRIHDPMDAAFTLEANEKSRGWSPFNRGIMVGINDETGVWMLKDVALARIESSGVTTRELTDAEVDEWLIEVSGHSPQLVAEVRAILDFQAESADS